MDTLILMSFLIPVNNGREYLTIPVYGFDSEGNAVCRISILFGIVSLNIHGFTYGL